MPGRAVGEGVGVDRSGVGVSVRMTRVLVASTKTGEGVGVLRGVALISKGKVQVGTGVRRGVGLAVALAQAAHMTSKGTIMKSRRRFFMLVIVFHSGRMTVSVGVQVHRQVTWKLRFGYYPAGLAQFAFQPVLSMLSPISPIPLRGRGQHETGLANRTGRAAAH